MSPYSITHKEQCFAIPSLWLAQSECDECGNSGITVGVSFLIWTVGIHFPL